METAEDLKQVVDLTESALAEEQLRSDNPWLACYTTRIALLRVTLELAERRERRRDGSLHGRIDALAQRRDQVLQQHGWDPPDAIKKELMQAIKTLLDV